MMYFAPLSSIPASLSGECSKQKKMIEDSGNPSAKANNLLKNLHRDVHNTTKTKTPSTEPNSVSSSVDVGIDGMNHYRTDLTKNRFSSSAAEPYKVETPANLLELSSSARINAGVALVVIDV